MAPKCANTSEPGSQNGHAETYHTWAVLILAQVQGENMNAEQENIVRTGSVVVVVLSRGSECTLIEVTGKPDVVAHSAALINAGFVYRGLAGIVSGEFVAAPDNPLDLESAFAMGRAHATLASLMPWPVDDRVAWLQKLYNLPDSRTEMN
jgi:hypothetical protein